MQTHYKRVVPMTPEPVQHLHQRPAAAADEGVVLTCYSYHWNNGGGGGTIEPGNCW